MPLVCDENVSKVKVEKLIVPSRANQVIWSKKSSSNVRLNQTGVSQPFNGENSAISLLIIMFSMEEQRKFM